MEVVTAEPAEPGGVEGRTADPPPDDHHHERRWSIGVHGARQRDPAADLGMGTVVSHDAGDGRRDPIDADPVRESARVDAVAEEEDRDVVGNVLVRRTRPDDTGVVREPDAGGRRGHHVR